MFVKKTKKICKILYDLHKNTLTNQKKKKKKCYNQWSRSLLTRNNGNTFNLDTKKNK